MKQICPDCGAVTTAASQITSSDAPEPANIPKDGDLGVCIECGEVHVFVNGPFGMALRVPTPEESAEADRNPMVQKFRIAYAQLQAQSE